MVESHDSPLTTHPTGSPTDNGYGCSIHSYLNSRPMRSKIFNQKLQSADDNDSLFHQNEIYACHKYALRYVCADVVIVTLLLQRWKKEFGWITINR